MKNQSISNKDALTITHIKQTGVVKFQMIIFMLLFKIKNACAGLEKQFTTPGIEHGIVMRLNVDLGVRLRSKTISVKNSQAPGDGLSVTRNVAALSAVRFRTSRFDRFAGDTMPIRPASDERRDGGASPDRRGLRVSAGALSLVRAIA
jgi:hypothetical protein